MVVIPAADLVAVDDLDSVLYLLARRKPRGMGNAFKIRILTNQTPTPSCEMSIKPNTGSIPQPPPEPRQ